MTKHFKSIPVSRILLCVFAFVLIADLFTYNTSPYFLALFIAIYLYMGIGMIKPLPKAKMLYQTVMLLLFLGNISQLIAFYVVGIEVNIDTLYIIRTIVFLTIPPLAYFYLRKSNLHSDLNTQYQ